MMMMMIIIDLKLYQKAQGFVMEYSQSECEKN